MQGHQQSVNMCKDTNNQLNFSTLEWHRHRTLYTHHNRKKPLVINERRVVSWGRCRDHMKRLLGVSEGTLVDADSGLVIHVAARNKLSRRNFPAATLP